MFHWGLMLSFVIGCAKGEEDNALHVYAGHALLVLILFRLVWGLSERNMHDSAILCFRRPCLSST